MLSKYDRAALSFGLESLESRRMLAATIGAGGVLNITGTSSKDTITLNKLSTGKLEVNINGTTSQFTFSATVASGKYTTISILAAGSDDTIVIKDNVSYKGATVMGEAGNDKITGGLGPDSIVGGSGQDQANYSARTDNLTIRLDGSANDGSNNFNEGDNVQTEEVYTGSGNDKIIGSSGPDGIFSGAGADQVDGSGGNDVINGSSGSDVLVGGADDDSVDAENNDADQVNTGDGIDFLAFDDGLDTAGPDTVSLLAQAKAGLGKFGANVAPPPSDLDPDYGDGGKQSGPDFGVDDISAVAVDSQGRVVFVGGAFVGSGYGEGGNEDMFVTRYTADGDLDTDFGDEGSKLIDFSVGGEGGSDDNAYGVAIGAGDAIVVVGSTYGFDGSKFAVARLTESGDLDESFSGDGKRTLSLDTDDAFEAIARDVAIQGDGNIVVAGDRNRVNTVVNYDPAAEFSPQDNPGGAWSYGFSPTINDFPTLYDTPTKLDDDGRDFWNSSTLPAASSLAPDVQHNGTGDTVAGIPDGTLALDPGFYGQYSHVIFTAPITGTYDVTGQFDGALVGDGATTDVHILLNGVSQFDGDIDVPAGAEGSSTASFELTSLFLNGGDTIDFVVGYGANHDFTDDTTALSAAITRVSAPDDQIFAVARFTDGGDVDNSFFGQGFNTIDVGSDERVSSVALQSLPDDSGSQRIVVGGSSDGNYVVARFQPDGFIDSGFGDFGGYSSHSFELGGSLNDIAVDGDNNIYAVGDALTQIFEDDSRTIGFSGGLTAAIVTKFDANGTFLDSVEEDTPANFDTYNGVTIDSSGHVVAVGTDDELYLVGRYDSDLNFDSSFGNGSSPSGIDIISESPDVALGAAVLSSGRILVGGYSFAGGVIGLAGNSFSESGTLPSAIRLVGDDQTPFEAENILDSGDLKDPPPELVERLAPTSDSAKIYFLSAPDADGNVEIKTNNSGADVVTITKITAADGTDNWAVTINGTTQYYAVSTTNSIKIITDGGADVITADNTVTVDVIVFAGDGDDKITGGAGHNLLFGEAGNDLINGGSNGDVVSGGSGRDEVNGNNGNDIVIGGPNLDTCNGGNGEDILIPGTTTYDGDVTALHALLDEWTSSNPNSLRITNIRSGISGGLNDPYYFRGTGADKTVFDDGSKDKLTGGAGRDWFFRSKNGPDPDVLTDGLASEEYDNL